jgi:hypothetical protein
MVSGINEWMSMKHWVNDIDKGKPKQWKQDLSQCHFIHHKSQINCPRIEQGPPRWKKDRRLTARAPARPCKLPPSFLSLIMLRVKFLWTATGMLGWISRGVKRGGGWGERKVYRPIVKRTANEGNLSIWTVVGFLDRRRINLPLS